MYFGMFNPMYYLFALPALLLGLYAQYKVRSAYNKYLKQRNHLNITGYEAAQRLLAAGGLDNVKIGQTPGELSDHYDPRSKTLALSQGVANTPSVAALGIVAHEIDHAMQDKANYLPLRLRAGMVPAVQVGSWVGPILFLVGMLLASQSLALVGLVLFSATLVFALVTLPVELNASHRAVVLLRDNGLVSPVEERGVQQVLSAAALTYVAAAIQALSTILYYLMLLSGGRRRS